MGANSDMAIIVTANVDPLAADMREAQKHIREFQKVASRGTSFDIATNARDAAKEVAAARAVAKEQAAVAKAAQSAAAGARGGWGSASGALASTVNAAMQAREAYAAAGASGVMSFAKMSGVLIAAASGLEAIKLAAKGVGWTFDQMKDSVFKAGEMEQTALAFEVMLNDAQQAKNMLAELRQFAAETPFNSRDVTRGAKSLLAYGVAADQIIPTLRMLGDVSAAMPQDLPLADAVQKYGQVYSQQRAYTADIKELAGRGVPIIDALTKNLHKSADEVRDLAEQGRIGRREYIEAFESMTSAGGKFFNMTKRQAETFLGTWEQMTDAFDLAKVKFGGMLIRDLGLRDAVKNAEAFGKYLDDNVERLSPLIRTAGNLAHAVGHVGAEFASAAANGANFVAVMGDTAFPEARQALQEFGRGLDDLIKKGKEFKISPPMVTGVLFEVGDKLASIFIDTLKGIRDIGASIRNDIVRPIGEGFQTISDQYHELRATMKAAALGATGAAGVMIGAMGGDSRRYRLPGAFEQDSAILSRYKALSDERDRIRAQYEEAKRTPGAIGAGIERHLESVLQDLDEVNRRWLDMFVNDPKHYIGAESLLRQGVIPSVMRGRETWGNQPGGLSNVIASLEERQAAARAVGNRIIADQLAKEMMDKIAAVSESMNRRQQIREGVGQLGIAGALGPWAVPWVGIQAPQAPQVPGKEDGRIKRPDDLLPGASDLRRQLREKYQPLRPDGELMQTKRLLDDLLARKEITPQMHDMGWRDALQAKASAMGLGGPTPLPGLATQGSAEANRIINAQMSGGPQQQAVDLLKLIAEYTKKMAEGQEQGGKGGGNQLPFPLPFIGTPFF